MYIPIEITDLILAYGFSWCMTTGRLVNKEWKERIDHIVHRISEVCIQNKKYETFILRHFPFNMPLHTGGTEMKGMEKEMEQLPFAISTRKGLHTPICTFYVRPNTIKNTVLFNIGLQIGYAIRRKTNINRFNLETCIEIYEMIYQSSVKYYLCDKIYDRIESLLEYTFSTCICDGKTDIESINNYRKFYKCIFGNIRYYSDYYERKSVNSMIEEQIEMIL